MKREKIKLNSVHFPFGRTWIDMAFTYEVAEKHGNTYKEISENYEKLFEDYNKSK